MDLIRFELRHGRYSLTRLIAGVVLVLSSLLALLGSPMWAVVPALVGVTHITSATLGFCPMEFLLHRIFKVPIKGCD